MKLQWYYLVFIVSILVVSFSCASHSSYNVDTHQEVLTLKLATLDLIKKGTEEYSLYKQNIELLMSQLDTEYRNTQERKNAELIADQWRILLDKEGNLVGGFFVLWEAQGMLSSFFVEEKQIQIAEAFDQIIALETVSLKNNK